MNLLIYNGQGRPKLDEKKRNKNEPRKENKNS
jgi:hypothetical protein